MAKRRIYTAEFKARVILEAISGVRSSAEICREQKIKPPLLSRWKAEILENAPKVFEPDEHSSEGRARIRAFERSLDQQALDLGIAKKRIQHLDRKPEEK